MGLGVKIARSQSQSRLRGHSLASVFPSDGNEPHFLFHPGHSEALTKLHAVLQMVVTA